jgi:hypothetical protein
VVAAWAVATGVGLIALMLAWSVANRATTFVWGTPVGPTVAFSGAIVVGGLVGSLIGRRLIRSVRAGDTRRALGDTAPGPPSRLRRAWVPRARRG